jgi:hypothetical protein
MLPEICCGQSNFIGFVASSKTVMAAVIGSRYRSIKMDTIFSGLKVTDYSTYNGLCAAAEQGRFNADLHHRPNRRIRRAPGTSLSEQPMTAPSCSKCAARAFSNWMMKYRAFGSTKSPRQERRHRDVFARVDKTSSMGTNSLPSMKHPFLSCLIGCMNLF